MYLLDDTGVRVQDDAGVDISDVTDVDGLYLFEGLPPGAYAVEFDLGSLPVGYVATFDNVDGDVSDGLDSDADRMTGVTPTGVVLASGESDVSHDLGVFVPVSVGDYVWDDLDGDGVQDEGEPGIADVGVTLFQVDPVTGAAVDFGSAVTDADGLYLFEGLPPGSTS